MFPMTLLRSFGCLLSGHAATVQIDESENRSELVCARCGAALGVFVTNLRKQGVVPATQTANLKHNGLVWH